MEETSLLGFGLFLEVGFVLLILWLFRPKPSATSDRLWDKFHQLKQDYQQIQADSQQQKTQLSQECARLRQELQRQNDQLMQEHLQRQQEWQQREQQIREECDRLVDERDRLVHEFEQQKEELTKEHLRLQQELEQQKAQFVEEFTRLQQEMEQQQANLIEQHRRSTFQQLQTLLVGYPSASKIAQAKPDLPAKNLTAMFTPLDNLLKDWGYEAIGPVWSEVAYNAQLHQPDSSDIQPREMVYIRFVGYRQGDVILCPAKVSRTLPVAK